MRKPIMEHWSRADLLSWERSAHLRLVQEGKHRQQVEGTLAGRVAWPSSPLLPKQLRSWPLADIRATQESKAQRLV